MNNELSSLQLHGFRLRYGKGNNATRTYLVSRNSLFLGIPELTATDVCVIFGDQSLICEDAIPPPVKGAIFRILQEVCGNTCKHALAQRLSVLLETDAEAVRLAVADDGIGFDPASQRRFGNGFGLTTIRERAEMTGGRLAIRSQLGKGTSVLATWRT